MKQKIIKSKLLRIFILIGLFACFFSCEREDINSFESHSSLKISSRKATVNEVLHKISSSSIKQKIVYENNRIIGKNNDINSSHNLRVNSQDSIFTVIEKENDFTTYLLPISSYTTENPFFLKYIITVDVNNIEKSGYIKYIPSTPTGILNLGTFSGTVEVYNIEDELIGLTTFENGIAQPQTSNSNNRVICYEQVTINEVTCSHGGEHGVGESCNKGFINDAYWYVSITTICNYDPTTIVQIIDDSSNPSMGGGSSNLNPNNSTLNKIIANLTMAQLDWWYSQNTSQETRDNIVNYVNQNNATQNEEEEAIDFVKELIDLADQKDSTFSFDNTISANNSLNFNTVQEFEDYLDDLENTFSTLTTEIINNPNGTKTTKFKGKFDNGLILPVYINVHTTSILDNPSTTNSEFTLNEVNSFVSGVTVFLDWSQDSYDDNSTGNITTVNINGHFVFGINIDGVPFHYTESWSITVIFNNQTGAAIDIVVTKI